jgi:hypothetical protein
LSKVVSPEEGGAVCLSSTGGILTLHSNMLPEAMSALLLTFVSVLLSYAVMDARAFLDAFGVDEAERVCARAGTKIVYFRQIANGHRRPSTQLAKRLADESGNRMDVISLLFPPARVKAEPVNGTARA